MRSAALRTHRTPAGVTGGSWRSRSRIRAGGAALAAEGRALGGIFLESADLRNEFAELKGRGVEFLEPAPEDYLYGMR